MTKAPQPAGATDFALGEQSPAYPGPSRSTDLAVLDLFAGAGGLSYGLEMAGLDVVGALEVHPHAALTFQRNHPDVPILVKDVGSTSAAELSGIARSVSSRVRQTGAIDCLVGGPPCQGFSFAGGKDRADRRNALPFEFVRLVRQLRPSLFVFENVYGLLKLYKGEVFKEILRQLQEIPGYRVDYEVLSAEGYGVPSMRRRVLIVGTRSASPFAFPEPTHASVEGRCEQLPEGGKLPFVSASEAIGDLDFLDEPGESTDAYGLAPTTGFQRWARADSPVLFNHEATAHSDRVQSVFALIPPGKGPEVLPEGLRSRKDGLLRMHPDRLCRAILSAPEDLIHYARDRIPTVREQARLQSFPDRFVFMGQRTAGNQNRKAGYCSQTQQVGNSVPPLLAYAMGRAIRDHIGE